SQQSGIPLDYGFIRNHYIGRTFIMPKEQERAKGVDLKLAIVPDIVRGKRLVVVDDSIVRGTTVRRRVARLRQAGATEVHIRVASPPCRYPCFYGVDFPTREELIASAREVEAIREFIDADSLGYLSLEGLLAAVGGKGFCTACFTGDYPVPTPSDMSKEQLERHRQGGLP
ncbi:MAG: amidophosphoribosyltransferase, partial [Spirochaetaceae bacterium]|nr:amidophosphoribosyltransferase [Spirochaetaceae bacterium]